MSKTDKLIEKLKSGSINANELRTLLAKMGWSLVRQKGSHESWSRDGKMLVLAVHGKDLKPYQIKDARLALEVTDEKN